MLSDHITIICHNLEDLQDKILLLGHKEAAASTLQLHST